MKPLTEKTLAGATAVKEGPVNAAAVQDSSRTPALTRKNANTLIKLAGLGALLLIASVTAYVFTRGDNSEPAGGPPITVQRQPLPMELHEVGTVEALNETSVVTRFSGDIVWLIQDGTFVEPGDPVARFETKVVVEDIESREKELFLRKEALRRAETTMKLTADRYVVSLRQKEIALETALIEHRLVFEKPKPEDRADAELTLRSAKLELERSELDMRNFDDLAKQGFASDAKRKEKLLDLATKRVNYAKAKSLYDLTVAGSTTEEKRVAELAVADAKKSLNIESFNRDADLAVCKAAVQLATVDLNNYERDLVRKKQDLEWATVRAPVRGHVVFNEVFKGSMKNKAPVLVGEQRAAGSELCMICDTSSLKLRVHINESNIKDIAMGQRARVTLQALPNRNFEAIVSEIAVVAQDKNAALSNLALRRSGEAFVNVVQVKLNFINVPEEDRRQIRVGFTADVYIQTGDKTLALSVPWKAVQYDGGGAPYCEVQTADGVERRALKIGRANGSHAEVLEGLADRDIVRNLNGGTPADALKNVSDNPKSSLPGGS